MTQLSRSLYTDEDLKFHYTTIVFTVSSQSYAPVVNVHGATHIVCISRMVNITIRSVLCLWIMIGQYNVIVKLLLSHKSQHLCQEHTVYCKLFTTEVSWLWNWTMIHWKTFAVAWIQVVRLCFSQEHYCYFIGKVLQLPINTWQPCNFSTSDSL